MALTRASGCAPYGLMKTSRERRQAVIGFGAVDYGLQTLDGLAAWLDEQALAASSPEPVQG